MNRTLFWLHEIHKRGRYITFLLVKINKLAVELDRTEKQLQRCQEALAQHHVKHDPVSRDPVFTMGTSEMQLREYPEQSMRHMHAQLDAAFSAYERGLVK